MDLKKLQRSFETSNNLRKKRHSEINGLDLISQWSIVIMRWLMGQAQKKTGK